MRPTRPVAVSLGDGGDNGVHAFPAGVTRVCLRTQTARRPYGAAGCFVRTPAMTYSRASRHYHRPRMLNGRVRNGNGCGHPGVLTGKALSTQPSAISPQGFLADGRN